MKKVYEPHDHDVQRNYTGPIRRRRRRRRRKK
jgi:hypothetical protein